MGNLPEIKTLAEWCTPIVLIDFTVILYYNRIDTHVLMNSWSLLLSGHNYKDLPVKCKKISQDLPVEC